MSDIKMKRSEWIDMTKDRLDELDRSLDRVEAKASTIRDDLSTELHGRIRSVRASLDAAMGRWAVIKEAANEVWDAVSEEISAAWDANRTALERSVEEIGIVLDQAANTENRAADGDTVRIRYEGEFEDGTPFPPGTRSGEFTLGDVPPLPGLDEAVRGLSVGEGVSVTIPAEDMFGKRKDELILKVPVSIFPGSEPPKLGDRFELRPPEGPPVTVTVRRVFDDKVEVDANHPLAGSDLHVDLELVGVSADGRNS